MVERVTRKEKEESPKKGSYFVSQEKDVELYSSGCTLLDQVLGGGYPVGRMTNIVGDKSSGKTLLAIEACANFAAQFPEGNIWYFEAESAFDKGYAQALGMPVERIDFVTDSIRDEKYALQNLGKGSPADMTVETFFEHLESSIKNNGEKRGLYILDSLDALSDRSEQDRKIDEGSYGTKKAAKLSELFRRLVAKLEKSNIHLLIVSQIRDNIGVTFGAKHTRSGGKAMDFYATQVLWLAEIKKLKKTVNKIERVIGVEVRAQCKKNKIGLPFRECQYPILFGYGIDDVKAHLEWLDTVDKLEELEEGKLVANVHKKFIALDRKEKLAFRKKLSKMVIDKWREIEEGFMPTSSKY